MASEQLRFFCEPLQFHLEHADLLEQLSLFGPNLLLVLGFLVLRKQLAASVEQLPLHLDHLNGVISGDLWGRFPAADLLHGNSGLEFGTVGASLAHGW
jgi:hypothetical protein